MLIKSLFCARRFDAACAIARVRIARAHAGATPRAAGEAYFRAMERVRAARFALFPPRTARYERSMRMPRAHDYAQAR